jgi:hypothetical protein
VTNDTKMKAPVKALDKGFIGNQAFDIIIYSKTAVFDEETYSEDLRLKEPIGDLTEEKCQTGDLNLLIVLDPNMDNGIEDALDVCLHYYHEIENNSHQGSRWHHLLFLASKALNQDIVLLCQCLTPATVVNSKPSWKWSPME